METVPPLNVRFDPESRVWIKQLAHLLNWSENKVVRECVAYTRMRIENTESIAMPRIIQLSKDLALNKAEVSLE